jgi:AraC-like DNA-binding protein
MPLVLPGHEVRLNEPGRTFDRHHHLGAYAALLIDGSCHETGDRGRFTAEPGEVFVHRAFDGHRDDIGRSGAAFINIPLEDPLGCAFGRVTDLDSVVRAFERSFAEGCEQFHALFEPAPVRRNDWPDMLADEISARTVGSISRWSKDHGLNPASVSRGFRLAYGISPKRFRLEQMAARAARTIRGPTDGLSAIAASCGFSDQAHMTRTMASLFGITPARLRRLS